MAPLTLAISLAAGVAADACGAAAFSGSKTARRPLG